MAFLAYGVVEDIPGSGMNLEFSGAATGHRRALLLGCSYGYDLVTNHAI
jgi:hypothetical protein